VFEHNGQTESRRGSSPSIHIADRQVDVWGERRLRAIKETPEDAFVVPTLTRMVNEIPI
jgi:hypothetical protein